MFALSTRAALAAMLAVAGAGAAQAESSVNAYGLIDMSAGQFQAPGGIKDKAVQSGNMSTSYFGFKGSEELGGPLKANFAIESFLRADTGGAGRFGADAFWARSAYVGLSGNFGSLNLGRNTTSLFVSTLVFNAFGDSFGFSPSIRHTFTSGTTTGDTGWNKSLSYTSPKLGNLTAQLQVGDADGTSGHKTGGNVLYFGNAFAGSLAYQKVREGGTTDGTTTWQLGGSYDLGVAKLFAQYGKVKNDTTDNAYKLTEVGAAVPTSASGKVLLQVGLLKPDTGNKRRTITAGYDYSLSKRSDLYVVYMNDHLNNVGTGNTYAVGLRHKF